MSKTPLKSTHSSSNNSTYNNSSDTTLVSCGNLEWIISKPSISIKKFLKCTLGLVGMVFPLQVERWKEEAFTRQELGCRRCGFREGNIIGTTFAKSSMLEFYDMNFYPTIAKASAFLKNIPRCGYLAGAAHTLRGRLHKSRAGLQHQGGERRKQRQPGRDIFQFHLPTANLFPDIAAPFPSTDRVSPNSVSVKPQVITFRWV